MGAHVKSAYATLVGDIVSARYRVVGEVGRTDFGVLYLAEDQQTPGRSVAINVLVVELPSIESERRRFEFETEALARRADIDLTDFINAGRLPDGRPFWVLACEAVVPDVITPETFRKAVTAQAPASADVARRLERYEIVPVYRRQTFLLAVYALPVLLAAIAVVGAKFMTEEPVRPLRSIERRLDYTVYAQKYWETLPVGDATPVELPYAFAPGERLRLEFSTPEEGYLYVVYESAPATGGTPTYTMLFPSRGRGEQAAYLNSNRPTPVPAEGHLTFTQGEEAEKVWVIWSSVGLDAFSGLSADSRLDATQISAIQQLISKRGMAPVQAAFDAASKRAQAKGTGDPWIQLIGLGRQ